MASIEEFLNGKYAWLLILGVILLFTTITIVFYLKKDKYDPEPKSRLFIAFIYGILSIIPAVILEVIGSSFFGGSTIATAIFVAPIVEEFCKGWFVIYLAKDDSFDGPLDGLIYGAMVGAGFASAENLLYGLNALLQDGSIIFGLYITTFRSLTQIIGHPFYTGLMGVGVGEYKVGLSNSQYNQIWRSIGLHALWNTAASLEPILFWPGLVGIIAVSIYILRKELARSLELDREAYERGYYEQKRRYLEEKKRRIKEQIRRAQMQPQWQPPQQQWENPPPWRRSNQNWDIPDQWSPDNPQNWGPSSRDNRQNWNRPPQRDDRENWNKQSKKENNYRDIASEKDSEIESKLDKRDKKDKSEDNDY